MVVPEPCLVDIYAREACPCRELWKHLETVSFFPVNFVLFVAFVVNDAPDVTLPPATP